MAYLFILIAIIGIFFYMKKLVKGKSLLLSFGLIFLVEIIWMFLSIIYIDGGTHIAEQGKDSYFTGASIRLFLIYIPKQYPFIPWLLFNIYVSLVNIIFQYNI